MSPTTAHVASILGLTGMLARGGEILARERAKQKVIVIREQIIEDGTNP